MRGHGLQFLFLLMAPEAAIFVFNAHVLFAETTEAQRAKVNVPDLVVDCF